MIFVVKEMNSISRFYKKRKKNKNYKMTSEFSQKGWPK